ncbi:MAG TPA: pyrrolysine--tRNA(Pyl) ligase small subunit [Anaerovoracaceae bacterium]|nr:pyrrolysine--tRNA(Pyl) ligase small subunit [Anaerovoracaceae bacterium]
MSEAKKRYYRKHAELYPLVNKIKLWPSRRGSLHGVRHIDLRGDYIEITTHCGKQFRVLNSRHSRAARWLRNKWAFVPCPKCKVPKWKLEKYSSTFFSAHYGKELSPEKGR